MNTCSSSVTINVKEIIEHQQKVVTKFPCSYYKTSQIVDSFIIQILEECYEAEDARINGTLDEFQFEIIDILMYLYSFYIALYFDLKCETVNDIELIDDEIVDDVKEVKPINAGFNSTLTSDMNSLMFEIRRKFPERKYHKPYDPSKIEVNRMRDCMNIIKIAIDYIFDRCIFVNAESFKEMLFEKESYINSLNKMS